MLSHVTLGIADIDDAMTFYRQLMEPLGWEEKFATRRSPPGPWAGWKPVGAARPLFIVTHPSNPHVAVAPGGGAMPGFEVASRAEVDAIYALALTLGGEAENAPAPGYPAPDYGAIVLDPWGNRICIICHAGEALAAHG